MLGATIIERSQPRIRPELDEEALYGDVLRPHRRSYWASSVPRSRHPHHTLHTAPNSPRCVLLAHDGTADRPGWPIRRIDRGSNQSLDPATPVRPSNQFRASPSLRSRRRIGSARALEVAVHVGSDYRSR